MVLIYLEENKDNISFSQKQAKIKSFWEQQHLMSADNENNEVILELLQSDNFPVLVNWKEKFESTEVLLNKVKSKSVKDEKRLLFYLSEIATNTAEFMTDKQIENELFYHIYPLIGEYMWKVHEELHLGSTSSNLILESLMRCLKQCLIKLDRINDLSMITFNWFIDYFKDTIETTKTYNNQNTKAPTSIKITQICSFVKVAYSFAQDSKNYLMYNSKTTFLITELAKLVQNVILKEIEIITSEKKPISQVEKDMYTEVVNDIVFLIFVLYSYIHNHFKHIEGSAIPNPHLKQALSLLAPFLYSSSDHVKRTVAVKIKTLVQNSMISLAHRRRADKQDVEIETTSKEYSCQIGKI